MVRDILIHLDDKDFEELENKKGKDISWKDFILEKCLNKKRNK